MMALDLAGISKSFGGRPVLQDVDLAVPAGSIYGFVGENGAGKTTTMKIILGLLPPDTGNVQVLSETVTPGITPTNRHIGYLSDVPSFYGYMRAQEYLKLCGEITGLTAAEIATRSKEVLEQVGLTNVTKKIGSYSRGMKQRLGLAQALLNQPALLICDEPTSALDPLGRRAFLDIFASLRGKTTVLFSTHILNDVEAICDHVAILHEGQIQMAGSLADIKSTHGKYNYQLRFAETSTLRTCQRYLTEAGIDSSISQEAQLLQIPTLTPETDGQRLLTLLAQYQLVPRRFELVAPSLEQIFLKVVGSHA